MKKILSLLMLSILIFNINITDSSAQKMTMCFDGKCVISDKEPLNVDGYTMVPLRFFSENLGYKVEWIGKEKKIIIRGEKELSLVINSEACTDLNNSKNKKNLNVAPLVEDGTTYVPLRDIAEIMGKKVDFDKKTKTISIESQDSQKKNNNVGLKVDKSLRTGERISKSFFMGLLDSDSLISAEDIFKKNDLTIINFWALWCGPCREELPVLAKIPSKLEGKNVEIIGVSTDATEILLKGTMEKTSISDEERDYINRILSLLSDANVKYPNYAMIPKDEKEVNFYSSINLLPTTVFVDSEGYIISDRMIGSISSEDEIINKVNEILK